MNRRARFSAAYALLLPLCGLVMLMTGSLLSYPRLAVEQSIPCGQCHISPGGGGARTEFGNHAVALNELCLPQTRKWALEYYRPPRVAESFLVGFDSRYLLFDDLSIFRMQTDFFVTFQPLDGLDYHLRFGEFGISENYVMATFADQAVFARAGRFSPTFGLKNPDHTSYNRMFTGHGPATYLDGIGVGGSSLGGLWAVELFDDLGQGIYGAHYQYFGYTGPVGFTAGASVQFSELTLGSTGQHPHARALFGGVSFDRITALGELDLVGRSSDTLVAYASLTTRLEYGMYLVGEYSFLDPERDIANGVDEFVRVSLDAYPISFVNVRPSVTFYSRGVRAGDNDWFVQFHVGY